MIQVRLEAVAVTAALTAVVAIALTSVLFLSFQHHPARKAMNQAETNLNQLLAIPNVEEERRHQEMVEIINNGSYWNATLNKFATLEFCNKTIPNVTKFPMEFPDAKLDTRIPLFDARKTWPRCALLQQPAINQGTEGSCWAVGPTGVISDRICVSSGGKKQPRISAWDVITCMEDAFSVLDESQQEEAYVPGQPTLSYWALGGIVTGGLHGTTDGCKPYGVPAPCAPCPNSMYTGERLFHRDFGSCKRKCGPWYGKSYQEDKHFGENIVVLGPDDVAKVQDEIRTKGPVAGTFAAFEDFAHYQSGVYKQTAGGYCYGHVVKIIGWGHENGLDYWLFANSYGEAWGQQGFGKIWIGHMKEYAFGDPIF